MPRILIGRSGKHPVYLDLKILRKTRMLITANSGGGKSYLLRLLAELLFPHIQVIIIDPEGEFATLREKFDYVLVGKGGEAVADVRTAELLAHRLLEHRISAVCDIFELKPEARHEWIRVFVEALMEAPKKLWRRVIVIIDEAHKYIPEKGQGESVAAGAVLDLCTRGRKRGYCAILASQRHAKVSKSATAELLNRLVGPTFEDSDIERAIADLSVPKDQRHEFAERIKLLEEGNFHALGRAISKERVLFKVNKVTTTHPDADDEDFSAEPPPPPEKVKALLPKLADLPKEAEAKARTEAELRAEIRSLKADLAKKSMVAVPVRTVPAVKTEIRKVEVPVVKEAELKRVEKAIGRAEKILERLDGFGKPVEEASRALRSTVGVLRTTAQAPLTSNQRTMAIALGSALRTQAQAPQQQTRELAKSQPKPLERPRAPKAIEEDAEEKPLVAGERRMLEVLAKFNPGSRTKAQIAQLSGYTMSGGTFSNYYNRLKKGGLIEEKSDKVTITGKGLEIFGGRAPEGPMNSEELLSMWRDKLIAGERKLLDALVQVYPEPLSKEDLGKETGYESSGGTFSNYLSTLRRNDLAVVDGNMVRAHEGLFQLTA